MNRTLKILLIVTILISIFDYVWLGLIQKQNWQQQVQSIQNQQMNPKIYPAIFTYIILIIAITFIAVPMIEQGNSLFYGALLGFCIYGIFNGTNYAIFENYTLKTALTDTLWGTFLCFIISYIVVKYN